jgi:hypothetical protein
MATEEVTMDKEDLWKRFQTHMGYTDAEMTVFRSDPLKVKMVTECPEFVKSRIVAEVIESHGCHAHHTVGQKFVMDGNGQMITRECPEKMCILALAALESPVNQIYERFIRLGRPPRPLLPGPRRQPARAGRLPAGRGALKRSRRRTAGPPRAQLRLDPRSRSG